MALKHFALNTASKYIQGVSNLKPMLFDPFPNTVENSVGKGEIARYEHTVSSFPLCFYKTCTVDM